MLRIQSRKMQIIFCLILISHAILAARDNYPNTKLLGMSGFAKKGGTTGGSNGTVVYIKNLDELKKHISNAVPETLVINKNIHSAKKVTLLLGSNKSIIGSWKSNVINNVYFESSPKLSMNIIFQNLVFLHNEKNIANGDTQIILDHGQCYWIDHCTFDGKNVNKNDLGKLLKISTVDYVTISNCKFMNHEYGLILGYPSDDPADVAQNNNYPRLTIMFTYFDDINARAPGLMRYGLFHVFNNYIHNCRLGFTVGQSSKIYSEFNYFTDSKEKFAVLDDKGNGYFKDVGSLSMPKKQESKLNTWLPSTDYTYHAKSTDYSRDFCRNYSGAQTQKLYFDPDN